MDLRQLIADQTDVSMLIGKQLSSNEAKTSNLVFSPLSIQIVLGLIAAGSKGSTLDQLLSFVKVKSADDLNKIYSELVSLILSDGGVSGGPELSFANGLWVDKSLSLRAGFMQVVEGVYKASSYQVDFHTKAVEVTSEVNDWAAKQTSGRIKEVLPPGAVDSSTRLIFANAIYFKGAWTEKFDASETRDLDFHLLDGTPVTVPFMTSKKKQFISTYDGFKVLSLRYKCGEDKRQFSMYLLLPDVKDELPALVEKVSSQAGFLDLHIPSEKVEVGDFRIPRFKISFGFEASNGLKGLGVTLPFSGGDLTEMVEDSLVGQNLYVSSLFQKSFVEVNEEGTEAAAASAAVVKLRSLGFTEKLDFVADHPFLFLIREDMTGVILFLGHVMNPLED